MIICMPERGKKLFHIESLPPGFGLLPMTSLNDPQGKSAEYPKQHVTGIHRYILANTPVEAKTNF